MTTTYSEPIVAPVPRATLRRGYWARWGISFFAAVMVVQAVLADVSALFVSAIWLWAVLDTLVALLVAGFAVVFCPALLDTPNESRLRMEEWVAANQVPESNPSA